jgi:hypothetical protein
LPDAGQERKEVELASAVLRAEGRPADRDLLEDARLDGLADDEGDTRALAAAR